MAILQRTLVSNSIWIGTATPDASWENYTNNNYPLAIYSGSNPLLYFQTSSTGGTLYFDPNSNLKSDVYSSGFGGQGFEISNNDGRWVGSFDDLMVRGSLSVYEFIINQIRATNGSLWVTDTAKAISVSQTDTTVTLQFDTGSLLPFVANDIIRSKRWTHSGSAAITGQWDVLLTLTDINYSNGSVTASIATGGTFYTNSGLNWSEFTSTASIVGTQWVRVGNTSDTTRQGAMYLTSTDLGGPFMDVYDTVSTVALAMNGNSGNVSQSKVKLRIGKLSGISDTAFGGTLAGYGLYADNAYLKGKIVANTGGNIAGWTIAPYTLSNNNMRLVASGSNTYLGIGAAAYDSAGIYIGTSSNGARFSIKAASGTQGLYWDGTNLGISSSNFTLSQGTINMSGTITSSAGNIGGWTLGTNQLSSGLVTISSLAANRYIGINASVYNGADGIYIGTNSNGRQFSIRGSGTDGLYWDGTNLGVSSSNFTLSQGSITATSGTIGGWSLSATDFSKAGISKSIAIRTQTSSNWSAVGVSGYIFDIDAPKLMTRVATYYSKSGTDQDPWAGIVGTSSISVVSDAARIQFTSSYDNKYKSIVDWKGGYDTLVVKAGETIFIGIKEVTINPPTWNDTEYADKVYAGLYTNSTQLATVDVFVPNAITRPLTSSNIFMSYTNNGATAQTCSLMLYQKNAYLSSNRPPFPIYGMTVSNVLIASSLGYTQVNPSGMLVYAGPTNYIKLSTQTNNGVSSNYGVMAIDTLYVGGVQVKGGEAAGSSGGTSGGVDGSGTGNYLSKWSDENTIINSSLYDDGSSVSSSVTIQTPTLSADLITGSGFSFDSDFVCTAPFGNIPSGSSIPAGTNILSVLQTAFGYQPPSFTVTTPASFAVPQPSKFIIPATELTTPSLGFNENFELPAKFQAITVSITASNRIWQYNNVSNINFATSTANLTASIAASGWTISNINGISSVLINGSGVLSAVGTTWSCTHTASSPITVPTTWGVLASLTTAGTIKDVLDNTITIPSALAATSPSTMSTLSKGLYGVRFFMGKASGATTVFKPCTITAGTTVVVNTKSGATWTDYATAFTASVPTLQTTTTYMSGKNLTLKSALFDQADSSTPVAIYMLAPSALSIWKTSNNSARWPGAGCKICASVLDTTSGHQYTIDPTTLQTGDAKQVGISSVAGDPQLALSDSDGIYDKLWPNGLSSAMRFFFIMSTNAPAAGSDSLYTWAT